MPEAEEVIMEDALVMSLSTLRRMDHVLLLLRHHFPKGGPIPPPAPKPPAPEPPIQENLSPPPPLLANVMDHQTHLMETLAEGLLHCWDGPTNDF